MAVVGSYTLYNDFENCPRKCFHTRIVKDVPKEETAALKDGIAAHEALDKFIKTKEWKGPDAFTVLGCAQPALAQVGAAKLQGCTVEAEAMLGITAQGNPCDFFAKDVWFRGKLDVLVRSDTGAWIIDWKTGKVREDPWELELQAVLVWAKYPDIEHIEGEYFWLREGRAGQRYVLSPPVEAQRRLSRLAGEMEECEAKGAWPAKPNPLCGWCPVKQCEHNRS